MVSAGGKCLNLDQRCFCVPLGSLIRKGEYKKMKLTQNKLSVILATIVAGVSILANCMTANAAGPVKTGLNDRYVLAGRVDEIEVFRNGIKTIHVVDENGEEWLYSYASMEETPSDGQKVTMVMNSNGTETIYDDTIEDVLWARSDEVNVD
nr:MAG TPA: hypothetical protein [Bacteriophage sp.]